jgi:hypothetical protein
LAGFSQDRRLLATGSRDGTIVIQDLGGATGRLKGEAVKRFIPARCSRPCRAGRLFALRA